MWYALVGLGLMAVSKAGQSKTAEDAAKKLDEALQRRKDRRAYKKATKELAQQQTAMICAADVALELERKRLEVEKLALEVEAARMRLGR